MKKESVPQERGIIPEGDRVLYATDKNGNFELAKSAGEECVNVANDQAWELVRKRCQAAKEKVIAGIASPLLYHLEKQQMDASIFASLIEGNSWVVHWHLKAKPFLKLKENTLARYAKALGISIEDLKSPFSSDSTEDTE